MHDALLSAIADEQCSGFSQNMSLAPELNGPEQQAWFSLPQAMHVALAFPVAVAQVSPLPVHAPKPVSVQHGCPSAPQVPPVQLPRLPHTPPAA
jgi:hypothetical protein